MTSMVFSVKESCETFVTAARPTTRSVTGDAPVAVLRSEYALRDDPSVRVRAVAVRAGAKTQEESSTVARE